MRPVEPPADPTPLVPVADATPVVPSPAPADEWADATAVELTDPPAEPAAPTPPQQITIINNYYNTPATAMTPANQLFGRN